MSGRPNILLFMTDQQRADSLGAFGSTTAITPAFDALAARGTACTNAFSQHSACSQSRASIMTGWYPHTAGHRTLDNLLKPWEPNLLRIFKEAGYFVAWAGARGDMLAPGVTEQSTDFAGFRVHPDPSWFDHLLAPVDFGSDLEKLYVHGLVEEAGPTIDEATVETALELLGEGMPEPWLLFVALMSPHPPFRARQPWLGLHDRASMPTPLPVPPTGKPRFMAELRRRYDWDTVPEHAWHEMLAVYHGMVSAVDADLGRLLGAVDAISSDHVVATFTDHGEYLGDFGLVEKWPSGVDECLLRNPLIVSVPDGVEGQDSPAMVEMVDLLPTLAEYAAIDLPHRQFGRSLGPLLRGEADEHRAAAYADGGFRLDEVTLFESPSPAGWYGYKGAMQHEHPEMVGTCSVVRTPEWTYVRRRYEGDELYDRSSDPGETVNLIADPAHRGTASRLEAMLFDWIDDTTAVLPVTRDPRMTIPLFQST